MDLLAVDDRFTHLVRVGVGHEEEERQRGVKEESIQVGQREESRKSGSQVEKSRAKGKEKKRCGLSLYIDFHM